MTRPTSKLLQATLYVLCFVHGCLYAQTRMCTCINPCMYQHEHKGFVLFVSISKSNFFGLAFMGGISWLPQNIFFFSSARNSRHWTEDEIWRCLSQQHQYGDDLSACFVYDTSPQSQTTYCSWGQSSFASCILDLLMSKAPKDSSVGCLGRTIDILIVKKNHACWLEKLAETMRSTKELTWDSPGPGAQALSFSTDGSVTLEGRTVMTSRGKHHCKQQDKNGNWVLLKMYWVWHIYETLVY